MTVEQESGRAVQAATALGAAAATAVAAVRGAGESVFMPVVPRPRWQRRIWERRAPEFRDGLMWVTLLAGRANVIMQLARPGVGHGVAESRVEGGRADLHPVKRARTTFTYLAVAYRGTDAQKSVYRAAVDGSHRQVRSTPESPVKYNAFNRDLQLWVAACLYKGGVDVWHRFIGEMTPEQAEAHYRAGAVLGTTLQVHPDQWPEDLAAFERYWNDALDEVHIDDAVRQYLNDLVRQDDLPKLLAKPVNDVAMLLATGFLPQRFRDEMRWDWDAQRQRRFDRFLAACSGIVALSPRPLREVPFNLLLADLDRRVRRGIPLV
ncbi:oxygenase MpaB family protein [Agromyces sp. SYSU T00194]|uniref:oxygenase MpaB family protein n=1 Tax=Agromyces chitinivorans TaxID=3158560 RepID=UPI00339B834F